MSHQALSTKPNASHKEASADAIGSTFSGAPARAKAVPKSSRPFYDPRIDFFRGLALVFIFINHIPDNAFSYLTSRTITLFDSAEVFMFLAGYSAALAYFSVVPYGLQAIARKAILRVRAILTYHLLLLVSIMAAAFIISQNAEIKTGYEVFFERIENDPLQVLIAAPLLGFQAPLLDILPMYVVVMLFAPYLIWLRARSEIALLVASGLIWMFASRFFPSIPTITYDVVWNFNPLCWQFLFAIGLIFGWRTRVGAPPIATGEARWVLDLCCVGFVAFSACVLMTIAFQTIDSTAANRLRAMYFSLNKQCLDLWRVVGLLASAYLVVRFIPKDAAWIRMKASRWVCAAGAASLPIFSLTVILSFAGKFITLAMGGDILGDALATGVGVTIMLVVAIALRDGWIDAATQRIATWLRLRESVSVQPR